MKEDLDKRLSDIILAIDAYYEMDLPDEADTIENKRLKVLMADLIRDAAIINDQNLKQRALNLLISTIGCHEDLEILDGILPNLISEGWLTKDEIAHFEEAPVNRWL
jgi:hypothetical protein